MVELTTTSTASKVTKQMGAARRVSGNRLMTWNRQISRRHGLVALGLYLALALYWDRATIAHFGSNCPCGLPGDPAQYTWAFVWFPHALLHGLSLLHTKAMWSPTGINLAGGTTAPFLAFALAPITWLWGPIVSYNVITILAPVTAASAAYLLCRHVSRSPWAALIAGVAFGFGTYEIAQLNGHLHLAVIFCPPLAVLTVLRFLQDELPRRRFAAQLGVILAIQFLISLEVFFTMTILGGVALIVGWAYADANLRSRIVRLIVPVTIVYCVIGVLMSWYIVALFHASAYAKDTGGFHPTDLLSLFTPMDYTWIGGTAFSQVTALFVAGPGETDAYVGLPMLLIVGAYLARHSHRQLGKWLAAMIVLTLLWVFGPKLWVAGKPTIWLPYALIANLPGFDQVLQGRVAVYFALLCSVVLALWLAERNRHLAAVRWTCGALAAAFVLPNIVAAETSNVATWTNPAFFSTGLYRHYLRPGETILPIRWGWLSESPLWQAETHMYVNLASGYFTTSIPTGWVSPLTDDLWTDTPHLADKAFVRPLVVQRHVSDIVVQRSEIRAWGPVLGAAGLHLTARAGGVAVYHVPASWRATRRR